MGLVRFKTQTIIVLESFSFKTLNYYSKYLIKNIFLNNVYKELVFTKRKRYTLLKSPHVNKTARTQVEQKTYKKVFFLGSTVKFNTLSKSLFKNKSKIINISLKVLF